MKVYLDNCCLNRPFDEQSSLVVRLETEAKLHVQELVRQSEIQLLWSFVLDYKNAANPFDEVRNRIAEWKKRAVADCDLSDEIAVKAHELMGLGLRQMDASHVACAISLGADCFLSTDKKILNKPIMGVEVMNPIDFVRKYSDGE
ncbi:MAG: hypothetical protein LBQ86_00360 [Holophagales bacterium]|jgi:predicted nucleic acid-binding protein|nr:hypothetical protein [Holophagales bacterium]